VIIPYTHTVCFKQVHLYLYFHFLLSLLPLPFFSSLGSLMLPSYVTNFDPLHPSVFFSFSHPLYWSPVGDTFMSHLLLLSF
jgi:hypothetical protein